MTGADAFVDDRDVRRVDRFVGTDRAGKIPPVDREVVEDLEHVVRAGDVTAREVDHQLHRPVGVHGRSASAAAASQDATGSSPRRSPLKLSPTSVTERPPRRGTVQAISLTRWCTNARTSHSVHGVGAVHASSGT